MPQKMTQHLLPLQLCCLPRKQSLRWLGNLGPHHSDRRPLTPFSWSLRSLSLFPSLPRYLAPLLPFLTFPRRLAQHLPWPHFFLLLGFAVDFWGFGDLLLRQYLKHYPLPIVLIALILKYTSFRNSSDKHNHTSAFPGASSPDGSSAGFSPFKNM